MDNLDRIVGLEPYSEEEREFVINLMKRYGKKSVNNDGLNRKNIYFDKLLVLFYN